MKAVSDNKNEYSISEPDLSIEVNKIDRPKKDFHLVILKKLFKLIYSVFNGVYKMSQTIEGLVETSSSLARVILNDGNL